MAVEINLDTFLDKEYESSSLADLLKAPVSALAGVSDERRRAPQGRVQHQDHR